MNLYKYTLIAFLLTIYGSPITAQDFKLGQVSIEEVNKESYEFDPEAEAIVLLDKGISKFIRVANSFDIKFQRYTKIKILSDAGLDYAEINIPLYREGNIYEKATDIAAYSYELDENGNIQRHILEKNQIFEEVINERWIQKKFAIPHAKKGSVIEYIYTVTTPYIFNLQDWRFQSAIPTLRSEYQVKMIPFYSYQFRLQGAKKFSYTKSYIDKGFDRQFGPINFQDYIHEYHMYNVPAFKDEDYISSVEDYIIKIDFQLSKITGVDGKSRDIVTTWPAMIKDLQKESTFGSYIKKAEKHFSKNIPGGTNSLLELSQDEKIEYATNYVKKNFLFNGQNSIYARKSIKEFTNSKSGNSANINLYLQAILNVLHVPSKPLLISTRKHGKIHKEYPFYEFFNYVLPVIFDGENYVFADGTDNLLPYNSIPAQCYNDYGLVIDQNQITWIKPVTKIPSSKIIFIENEISSENNFNSNIKIKENSTNAIARLRKQQINNSTDNFIQIMNERDYFPEEGDFSFDMNNGSTNQFQMEATFNWKNEILGDKIYISPFLNELIKRNPFTQKERDYPIDMNYPNINRYSVTLTIPEGYEIEYLPEADDFSNNLMDFSFSYLVKDNTIQINLNYYFKHSEYPPQYYSKMKYYFGILTELANSKVVLKKRENEISDSNE